MSCHQVSNVGSTEHEPPEMVWEVLVEVPFVPSLTPDEIGKLQDRLERRLNRTVREILGENQFGRGLAANVTSLRGRGELTPLFPLLAGGTRFTCNLDVVQMVERLCHETDLRQISFDARGRAYELNVDICYTRCPELDGRAAAPLPDAGEVVRQDEERRLAPRDTSWPLPRKPSRARRGQDAA